MHRQWLQATETVVIGQWLQWRCIPVSSSFFLLFLPFLQPDPFSFSMFCETLDFRNFALIGNLGWKFFYFCQNALKSKTKTLRGYFISDSPSKRKFSSVSYKTKRNWQLWSLSTPCLANETLREGEGRELNQLCWWHSQSVFGFSFQI